MLNDSRVVTALQTSNSTSCQDISIKTYKLAREKKVTAVNSLKCYLRVEWKTRRLCML